MLASWVDRASQVALVLKKPSANEGDIGDTGLIPGLGRSPGGGQGNPLRYSSLENPMDRGALLAPWGHKECDTSEGTYPVCLWWIAWASSLIFYPTLLLRGLLSFRDQTVNHCVSHFFMV